MSTLVLGGTGHLGSAVVDALAARKPLAFTYLHNEARAREVAARSAARALSCDIGDAGALRAVLAETVGGAQRPALVHCAVAGGACALADIDDAAWQRVLDVNVRSAFVAAQVLARAPGGADIVLTAALDGSRPLPAPAHFAASQGALTGLVRALAKELGPRTRINLVLFGLLDGGVTAGLSAARAGDYAKFSALGRAARAAEAARVIAWTLDCAWMTGAVVPATGGL